MHSAFTLENSMERTRKEMVRKYGEEVVAHDETLWKIWGYRINYTTGLLEQIN